jgi:predicted transcriptional regulator
MVPNAMATQPKTKKERATIRLSLDVSPEVNDVLEQLADAVHGTKSEVLRRSIALFALAVQAKQQGKKIGIVEKEQLVSSEIVGLV